ncbi:MAG: hypothetical protein H6587_12040 [Flavobacteriales bacterium]|nr:hypothetical protein [Flavobacteriales bacterium]MCB9365292.1 hypothetical protein [Flavobacteriales bacterium]
MDNYQKLFEEQRPPTNNSNKLPNTDDLNSILESGWLKDKIQGIAAYKEKDYATALSFLNKAIEENSDNQHSLLLRAAIKQDMGDSEGAISDYKKSLYLYGDWYSTYQQIGLIYFKNNNFDKAIIAFDISIDLKTNLELDEKALPHIDNSGVIYRFEFEVMYTNRGNAKLNIKDVQGCANDCLKAKEFNPEYANSYFICGLALLEVNQNEAAMNLLGIADNLGHPLTDALFKKIMGGL